jgi:predicted nuclease of predicted toxin-antitoxin system
MKILLDECIPRKFKNSLADHECLTVPEAGLAGKKNGELLSIAEHQEYTIFLTMDKGFEYEQNLKHRSIAIMILRAKSNRLVDLLPLVRDCLRQMSSIRAGQIVRIGR